jgi:hypothetical protein
MSYKFQVGGLFKTQRGTPFLIQKGAAEGGPWDSVSMRWWNALQGSTDKTLQPGDVTLKVPMEYLT